MSSLYPKLNYTEQDIVEHECGYKIAELERPDYWSKPEINKAYPIPQGVVVETWQGTARQVNTPHGYYTMVCDNFVEKYGDTYGLVFLSQPKTVSKYKAFMEELRGKDEDIKYYYVSRMGNKVIRKPVGK